MAPSKTPKMQTPVNNGLPALHGGSHNPEDGNRTVDTPELTTGRTSTRHAATSFRTPSLASAPPTAATTMAGLRFDSHYSHHPYLAFASPSPLYSRNSSIESDSTGDYEFAQLYAPRPQAPILQSHSWSPGPMFGVNSNYSVFHHDFSFLQTPSLPSTPSGSSSTGSSGDLDPLSQPGIDSLTDSDCTSSSGSSLFSPSPVPSHEHMTAPHQPGPIRPKRPKPSARVQPMGKQKADFVRELGACWRCRRYKKSCDGPGSCTNCLKGNFRVWPHTLGCRRGCLEDLVSHILPAQAADVLGPASRLAVRRPNWRFSAVDPDQRRVIEERLPNASKLERILLKAQSTGMYGSELASLFDILAKYQNALSRPNSLVESSTQLLDAACDIYHNFVLSAWPLPPAEITKAITTAQRGFASVCKMFLTSALSGRRRDWVPSFLSMSMSFVAIMIIMDAAIAVPQPSRDHLWGSLHAISKDLRTRLFPTITDLLRASSNGTKPFALGCWTVAPSGVRSNRGDSILADEEDFTRSPEGMRLLGQDKAAFDGMRGLQEWIRRNISLVELGGKVIRSDPFSTPEVPCIAPVLRLFDL